MQERRSWSDDWRLSLRVIAGFVALIAVVLIGVWTGSSDAATRWLQGLFYLAMVGVALGAIYVMTRTTDA